jgi:hypothetical protein
MRCKTQHFSRRRIGTAAQAAAEDEDEAGIALGFMALTWLSRDFGFMHAALARARGVNRSHRGCAMASISRQPLRALAWRDGARFTR